MLWILGSVWNIYQGLQGIIGGLGVLPYLSDPRMPEWFRFSVPAEIILNFFVVALGFLTLLVVYGLWTAGSWSYHFALALPVFIAIINLATIALNASTPIEIQETLGEDASQMVSAAVPFLVWNFIWLGGVWSYMMQPHVKRYLNQIPTPTSEAVPVPPSELPIPPLPSVSVTMSFEKKFCRYCGAENKTDAVFCEKCGRKIE